MRAGGTRYSEGTTRGGKAVRPTVKVPLGSWDDQMLNDGMEAKAEDHFSEQKLTGWESCHHRANMDRGKGDG